MTLSWDSTESVSSPAGTILSGIPIIIQLDSTGNSPATNIWSNAELNVSTYYMVNLFDQNGVPVLKSSLIWGFTATSGTVDLGSQESLSGPPGWGFTSSVSPIPPTPTNITTLVSNSSVTLVWQSVPSALSYSILRSTTPASGYEIIGTAPATITAMVSYTDSTVTNGVQYYYKIQTNSSTSPSPSNPTLPLPALPNSTAAPTNTVTGLFSIPWVAGPSQLGVVWTGYNFSDVAGQAVGNRIQQSLSPSGPWTTIAIVPGNTTNMVYFANNLTDGTEYYYQIAAGFLLSGTPTYATLGSTKESDYSWGSYCTPAGKTPARSSGQFNYNATTYSDTGTVPTINPGAVLINWNDGADENSGSTVESENVGGPWCTTITYSGWTVPDFASISQIALLVGSEYAVYPVGTIAEIAYSLNSGSTWTNIRSSGYAWTTMHETVGGNVTNADYVSILSSQDLTKVQVRCRIAASTGACVMNVWEVLLQISGT